VLGAEQRHGQDGFVVQDLDSRNGWGSYRRAHPRWVPTAAVTVVERKAAGDGAVNPLG
jgi:hypothetical protein